MRSKIIKVNKQEMSLGLHDLDLLGTSDVPATMPTVTILRPSSTRYISLASRRDPKEILFLIEI